MSKPDKKQTQQTNTPEEELLRALRPLKSTKLARDFINSLNLPTARLPTGENANAEKFLLAIFIAYSLFHYEKNLLLKKGNLLKKYIRSYAKNIPLSQSSFVTHHFQKLIGQNIQPVLTQTIQNKR